MNGETSREEKTPDPSSSTPASPESRCSDCWATNCEDRPKPCRCTCHRKCQAEDTTPASLPTEIIKDLLGELDGIALAYNICRYGLPLGHSTREPEMIAAVNEWLKKLASVRAAMDTEPVAELIRIVEDSGKIVTFACVNVGEEGYRVPEGAKVLSREPLYLSVRAASTGTGWIPVSERMPEYDTDVCLWASDWNKTYIGYWRHSEEWIGRHRPEENELPDGEPTHWQPLPAPPVASQKGKEAGQ